MMPYGKRSVTHMRFFWEINKELWQLPWPPTPSNISTRTSFIAISNLTTSSWALESVEIRSMSLIVQWLQDPFSHPLPREQESHQTAYIKSVRLRSICHILTWGLVHPFTWPVLTDTLCISPEPLKRIHCILSKRVWSCLTQTSCFPTALRLGSQCVLSPDLFWLTHCPFRQNHSNGYIVNCLTWTSCFLTTWQLGRLYNVFFIEEYHKTFWLGSRCT